MKSFKLTSLFIVALVVVFSILNFNNFAKNYFVNSNKVLYNINLINNLENDLNYEILKNSLYLYTNNDLIAEKIHKIKYVTTLTLKNSFLRDRHPKVYKLLQEYQKEFNKKTNVIFTYLRFALPVKNAMTYIGYSLKDLNLSNKNSKKAIESASSIFLAKASIDKTFIKYIDINKLEGVNKSFILNLNIFLNYFPKYQDYLKKTLNSKTKEILHKALNAYMLDLNKDLKIFKILSFLMVVFLIIIFMGIIYLVFKLEKSIQEITYLLEYDTLTSLPNRYKFIEDSKSGEFVFVLINIDRFKNINDYFGIEVGDNILKYIGDKLKEFSNSFNATVYRMGADDFGVLVNKSLCKKNCLMNKLQIFIDNIEKNNIKIFDNIDLNISLSAGVSDKKPYFENADLALKSIKNDYKKKIGIFDEKYIEEVKKRIELSNEIINALKNDNIRVVFQPIYDKFKNIIKYEVLCRVLVDGKLKSIFPYLKTLKENKLYTNVTMKVLEYSKNVLEKYNNVNLSINLSMEDILDDDVTNYINNNIIKYKNRVTFEILESEIADYKKFEEFISKIHNEGVLFAIDDFGSGYSNFERILRLNIDYVKIDGSLIKNIDNDIGAEIIVETIVEFAKKSGVKTVAEYIHNEDIFEVCKRKEIDYYQGFYLSEPKELFEYRSEK